MIKAKVINGKPVKVKVKEEYIPGNINLEKECYILIYTSLRILQKVNKTIANDNNTKEIINDLEEMLNIVRVEERNN